MPLVDMAADDRGPRQIDCYSVEVERFDAVNGKKFKLDPSRLVYSLLWQHKAEPPDFELVLIQGSPQQWVNTANLTLLGELRRRAMARRRQQTCIDASPEIVRRPVTRVSAAGRLAFDLSMTFEQFAATVRDWANRLAPAQARLAAESIMVIVDDLPLGTTFYRALAMVAKPAPAAARDQGARATAWLRSLWAARLQRIATRGAYGKRRR